MRTIYPGSIGLICMLFLTTFSMNTSASVVIKGTRVIYKSDRQEVSVKLENMGAIPVLIQSWVDEGDIDARPDDIKSPFILTPPINRLDPGKGQTLRLRYVGSQLPMDKESVFWLNVLEIPAKKKLAKDNNSLQMAFRSRLKIFYRPASLSGLPHEAVKFVSWQKRQNGVEAKNSSPYFISFASLSLAGNSIDGDMIPPKSSKLFKLKGSANQVKGTYVNDYGAIIPFESNLN
ncbi:fimbrial biogenesis chaperone [Aeromonas rivuli]|uniref:fimbrial biogenesis chaperone n=1 Tax=Aeromonas rivuli TaxID=648794 RepID=UPI001CCE5A6D|nr:fimbria/pilus periplasmic chaperone [Aeromonas rivuli]UBO72390.1 fimbria/pilus periplasmic chaperone [Aeromonas rivuli]